jgi:PAS domain S-box-containing protein
VTDAIRVLVTSLGDFPLEPDAGKAWLWTGDGARLIWASDAARADLGIQDIGRETALAEVGAFRGFQPLLDMPAPDREPVRVQQLSLGAGVQSGSYTCLCRHVPLAGGGYGLLAVAIGAPARSMAAVRGEEPPAPAAPQAEPIEAPILAVNNSEPAVEDAAETPPAVSPPAMTLSPSPPPARTSASAAAPAWLANEPSHRAPLRFVWQTDANGRFVHLSRELAEAVGAGNAMLLGKTWRQAVDAVGLQETNSVASGFGTRDTWTAEPVLWPVEGSAQGVPVEMAGIKVMEAGEFAGFRGYGIARVERAVARPRSAAQALATDVAPVTDMREDRFGPAALRAMVLDNTAILAPADASKPTSEPRQEGNPAPGPVTPAMPDLAAPSVGAPVTAESHAAAETSRLTPTERDAFREIARALSGLREGPAARERDAAGAEPRRAVRPLEIIKQDLERRIGVRPEAAASAAKPPAPIIPYDALQARREQKQRVDPLQAAAPGIIEKLPTGLLVMQDGKAVFANRPLLDMAGYADLEVFIREGGADRLFGKRKADAGQPPRQFTIATRDGGSLSVEAMIQPIVWDEQQATLTSFRRVQDAPVSNHQKALELDLLAAQAELRELQSVLDTATDGVILLDGEGRILGLNRSAEALFGFDQNEIAGENLTILLEPESHIAALDYLEGLRSNGVHSILNDGRDVKGRERNGGVIPLFMTIGRLNERHGASKFCAVLRDITHWKKVESDLLDAKRAAEDSSAHKTDFLAKISHEIRTPLNAIIGFSQVMISESFGPVGNERYRQYAKDINASGEHIVSLVNDLLDLAKVAAGKLELNFARVDVNALVAASVAMIQPQANAGKVIVRSQLAPELPPVVADERSIRQIMLNLLSNAAKFTEAGGQVVASTSVTDKGEVAIRVRDTGIGMAADEVKKAMEPFRQIPGPRASGGTGLGLPLTKALVEANRAALAIQSEPRKGTLVEVLFPSTRVLAE